MFAKWLKVLANVLGGSAVRLAVQAAGTEKSDELWHNFGTVCYNGGTARDTDCVRCTMVSSRKNSLCPWAWEASMIYYYKTGLAFSVTKGDKILSFHKHRSTLLSAHRQSLGIVKNHLPWKLKTNKTMGCPNQMGTWKQWHRPVKLIQMNTRSKM